MDHRKHAVARGLLLLPEGAFLDQEVYVDALVQCLDGLCAEQPVAGRAQDLILYELMGEVENE